MYTIQTNASGTRSMEISEENLLTDRRNNAQHLYSGICGFKLSMPCGTEGGG